MGGRPPGGVAMLLSLALMLGLASAANGAPLYSNLDGGAGSSGWETTQTQWLAEQFSPTASGTARLASFWAVSYLGQTTSVSVSIYTNNTANGGQPGSLIAVGTPATIGDSTGAAPTCTALSGAFGEALPTLSTGQTYWAVMKAHASNTGNWLYSGAGLHKVSTNSGSTWATTSGSGSGSAFSVRVDDAQGCAPDITTNPDPGVEIGDMYAKPSDTGFQTLFVTNNGIAQLNLTGGSFSGPSASTFKLLNGEPNGHPPGTAFTFPKTIGTSNGSGGIIMYVVCAPPAGTADGEKTATFTLTSNDPDEGSLSWPVWCLVDTTPPSLQFNVNPDGRDGWFITRPAPIQIQGIDPESGNRVKRIFCSDNGAATLDWPNGSVASFGITPDGTHALSCQGTDVANNTSAPGAYSTTVNVDATPPDTTKGTGGPPATSEETAFSFPFAGTDATSGVGQYECSLDGKAYAPCTSPASRSGLHNGTHTFDVRARDVAGNADLTPVRWTWDVAAPPPQAADDAASTTEDAASDIAVLANDTEPHGGTLAVSLDAATTDKGGAVSVAGSNVHYVPSAGFVGTDRFSYRAVNGTGVMSAAATVTVEVAAKPSSPSSPSSPDSSNSSSSLVATPAIATSLALKPAIFRAATGGASAAARKKTRRPPVGSTVRYLLDKPSPMTFTVEQATRGKRRGASCVKPARALRKAKNCTRYVKKKGAFTLNGTAGLNSFRFTGRLSGKPLRAGRYRLIARPEIAAGIRATAVRAKFRISK